MSAVVSAEERERAVRIVVFTAVEILRVARETFDIRSTQQARECMDAAARAVVWARYLEGHATVPDHHFKDLVVGCVHYTEEAGRLLHELSEDRFYGDEL